MAKHKKTTLMNWNKEKLVEEIMILEQNNENLKWNFEVQYKNCMNIVNDMNLLNEIIKNKSK